MKPLPPWVWDVPEFFNIAVACTDAHLGTPPFRPTQEEPRFADLDRAAAGDGNPLPRPVEDEDCEEDGDNERHRPPRL